MGNFSLVYRDVFVDMCMTSNSWKRLVANAFFSLGFRWKFISTLKTVEWYFKPKKFKKRTVFTQTGCIFKGLQVYSRNFQVGKPGYTVHMRTMFVAGVVRSGKIKGRSG